MQKAAVDLTFFRSLSLSLVCVFIHNYTCCVQTTVHIADYSRTTVTGDGVYIVFVAAMLLLRTYFDIWVIRNMTAIERWDKRITTEIPV